MPQRKFKHCEAIVWEPKWLKDKKELPNHPLRYGELVYFLGEIPNIPGHCIVVKYSGETIAMVHPEDFRRAKEEEL